MSLLVPLLGFGKSELTRLPYLQEMTSHSVLIAWRTREPSIGEVTFMKHSAGMNPMYVQSVKESALTAHHVVRLENLKPDTTYWYQIGSLDAQSPLTGQFWFKTFPDAFGILPRRDRAIRGSSPVARNVNFSFGVLGDSGNHSAYQLEVAHQLFLYHPDLLIHTGDVIYGGRTDADYDFKFFSVYAKLLETTPVFPSIGNHDASWNLSNPYLENFYLPQNSPGKGRYYSFNCGSVHFDALDSNEPLAKGSLQYSWFVKDLSGNHLPIKVVFFHHPIYSSGYHGSTLSLRRSLQPVFDRFHVTVVFNGHDHDYERTIPIHGVTYVVTGGGGGVLYPAGSSKWTAYSATVHHFVLCQVNGTAIKLEAIDDKGKVFDRDTIQASR